MKKLFLILLSCMIVNFCFGQINEEIKKRSKENQSKKNNNSGGGGGGSSTSTSSDTDYYSDSNDSDIVNECLQGCVDGCASECGNLIINALGEIFTKIGEVNGEYIDNKKEEVPYILSADLGMQLGFLPNQYLVYLPQIHGQAGVFSTDFRVYHNQEYRFQETDSYRTWDWQILQFNIVSTPVINFKVGSGFMFENFGGQTTAFNEHSTVFNIYPLHRLRFNIEGRLATDYQTSTFVRKEIHTKLMYQLNQNENFKWNLVVGGLYAKYYEVVDVWTISLGTGITFQ